MDKILIIGDGTSFLDDVETLLRQRYVVARATTGKRGLEIIESELISAVLLELTLPDMHGLDVLKKIHADIDPHLPVIIFTNHPEADTAVTAMNLGAYDFVTKDLGLDALAAKVLKALERRHLELSVKALQSTFAEHQDAFIFVSDTMKRVNIEITRLSQTDFDILITGETGVGKDLIAFEIHRRSRRRDKPFIAIPMKTLSETLIESELFGHERGAFSGAERTKIGKLEAANGGTVYIPEVSSLAESVQLKLLQFLQYKTVSRVGQDPKKPDTQLDVRVVMATNVNPEEKVHKGEMRKDFFHRITGVRLNIPPLREHRDDIEPLASYFLKKYSQRAGDTLYEFSPGAIELLKSHRWSGNVRELENCVKNVLAYAEGPVIGVDAFPRFSEKSEGENQQCHICMATQFADLPPFKEVEVGFKRAYFQELLRRSGHNIQQAASNAGMTPQGLRKLLHTLGIAKN
jgi:DNA-binding NtrC family response regulator